MRRGNQQIRFSEQPDYTLNRYLCKKFDYGYIKTFSGEIYNSYDYPEMFDNASLTCTEKLSTDGSEITAVASGDTVGSLTCTGGYAEYYLNGGGYTFSTAVK